MMTSLTQKNTIVLIALLVQISNAYVNNFGPISRIWATNKRQTINPLKMSAVEKSFSAEEINSRLAAQLVKLKAKDASSIEVKKEVCDILQNKEEREFGVKDLFFLMSVLKN